MMAQKYNQHYQKNQGLTLLELMIALLIFSIVAVIVVTGMRSVISSREQTSIFTEELKQLQMAHFQMQRDFAQMLEHPVIDAFMTSIEFTANGFTNPLSIENRSTLQFIRYEFDGYQLIRSTWQDSDQGLFIEPDTHVLIEGIDDFMIEADYLDKNILPAIISVNFVFQGRGHVHWSLNTAGGRYG